MTKEFWVNWIMQFQHHHRHKTWMIEENVSLPSGFEWSIMDSMGTQDYVTCFSSNQYVENDSNFLFHFLKLVKFWEMHEFLPIQWHHKKHHRSWKITPKIRKLSGFGNYQAFTVQIFNFLLPGQILTNSKSERGFTIIRRTKTVRMK